jgi:ATP-binding cassette subfamily F protein 3
MKTGVELTPCVPGPSPLSPLTMLHLVDIDKSYGQTFLFEGLSWHVSPGKRIGMVGRNGAGKTTLFRIISGQEEPEAGRVVRSKHTRVGYLVQEVESHGNRSVLDVVTEASDLLRTLEKEKEDLERKMAEGSVDPDVLERYATVSERFNLLGGYQLESEAKRILAGLGFSNEEMEGACANLSGGWLMRVGLARLLLMKPELLLLDEPSNHLDSDTLDWFEAYVVNYTGTVIFISHDRALLNRMATEIAEVSKHGVRSYTGNYDAYVAQRAEERAQRASAHTRQSKSIAQTERFIERFRAKNTKATAVQSRVKMLSKLERIEAPDSEERSIQFSFQAAPRSGHDVLKMEGIGKRFGDNPALYTDLDFTLYRQNRVALVGPNGAGKTTLLRLMAGDLKPDTGEVSFGASVEFAYYAQHQADALHGDNTVLQEMEAEAKFDMIPRLRGILGAFGFTGEDVDKRIHVLSGGEKARVALAKILLRPVNFLLLDEPTNHLDLPSCAVLENALKDYEGTLLVVSHDRTFINAVTDEVVEVQAGQVTRFPGNFDYYTRKKREARESMHVTASNGVVSSPSRRDEKRRKAELRNALHRKTKELKAELSTVEARIAELEEESEAIDGAMLNPDFYDDRVKMEETYQHKSKLEKDLAMRYARWETLGTEIEASEASHLEEMEQHT